MLSREERRQIQKEEVAAAQAVLARRQEQKRRGARWAYRREVRAALNPRVRTGVAALLTGLVLAGLTAAVLRRADTTPDDTSGGVASSVLMARCEEALRTQVALRTQATGNAGELRFPDGQDAALQITASPDGKRWDGSFSQEEPADQNGSASGRGMGAPATTDFSCIFTVATGEISTELIAP